MGSEEFLRAKLDRANHHETIAENRTAARNDRKRVARAFVRLLGHGFCNGVPMARYSRE
jgi:hypothetical protein